MLLRAPMSHVVSTRAKKFFSPALCRKLFLSPSLFLSLSRFHSLPLTFDASPRSSFSPGERERDYYFRLKCPPFSVDRVRWNIVKSIPKSPLCFPKSSDRSRGKSNFSFDQNSFQSRADFDLSDYVRIIVSVI